MKKIYLSALLLPILMLSCKTEPKKTSTEVEAEQEKTVPERIADAYGYENWKSVKEIKFTFNVDRDTAHFERSWAWKPKSNEITAISATDTLTYNKSSMDSITEKTNGGFINDRYWLLAPFNLMWDSGNYKFDHAEGQTAPISGENMQKLTIVYANEGGYTPGDAYDFYFKDDFIIREWVYRKSNQDEPSLITTWEDYTDIEGIKLVQDHVKKEGEFRQYFTNLSISKE